MLVTVLNFSGCLITLLGTEFTRQFTDLEFRNLSLSMTLLALHSSHGSFLKRCLDYAYVPLKCSACLEAHTCVSNFFL